VVAGSDGRIVGRPTRMRSGKSSASAASRAQLVEGQRAVDEAGGIEIRVDESVQ